MLPVLTISNETNWAALNSVRLNSRKWALATADTLVTSLKVLIELEMSVSFVPEANSNFREPLASATSNVKRLGGSSLRQMIELAPASTVVADRNREPCWADVVTTTLTARVSL